jgi:hypothetical protein
LAGLALNCVSPDLCLLAARIIGVSHGNLAALYSHTELQHARS